MNGGADLNDILSKLTENPDTMKTLMSVAGNILGSDKSDNSEDKKTNYKDEKECHNDYCDSPRAEKQIFKSHKGDDAENLIRLLLALKPYVSHSRCEKIESIIKILKLIQLSEKTGLLKSFL